MKIKLLYYLLFLSCGIANAQINFSVLKQDVKCNSSEPGSIEINVLESNPPYSYSWNTGQTTHIITGLEPGYYSVTVSDSSGNDTLITIQIKEQACAMLPEQAFTPNSDGYNDTWFILNAQYFPDALILVYDRMGRKIYENIGLYDEPWDGRNQLGIDSPSSSYFYIIFPDKKDESTLIKGNVTIMK